MVQKRVDAGDAESTIFLAMKYYMGGLGLKKMYNEQSSCGRMRRNLDQTKHIMNLVARTSIVQDRARALEHWQLSAMKGHAHSRHGLGVLDSNKGNYSD